MSFECLNDLLSELGEEENMNIEGGAIPLITVDARPVIRPPSSGC